MPVQITIIGLGKIGASMGLALGAHKKDEILRVGHDKDMNAERSAQQAGAVDKAMHNLPSAVEGAQLVVLTIPADQVRATLEYIALDVKENTVIVDTSPIKTEAAKWVKELLPKSHYVGLAPALNPNLLHDFSLGADAAHAELFANAACFIAPAPGVPEEAATLAVDFVRLLGAHPVLTDIPEADGLTTTAHLLPQLVAAALLNATLEQPGWAEARKLASRAYALTTSAVEYQDETTALKTSVMQNRAGVMYALDVMLAALRGLRDDLDKNDAEGIAARLDFAAESRRRWLDERARAEWHAQEKPEIEDRASIFGRLFGTTLFKKRDKK